MKKFNQVLTMTLTSLLVVQPVFALLPEALASKVQKETVVRDNLVKLNETRIKEQAKVYPYGYTINFVDKFGNYLYAETQNHGKGYSVGSVWDKPLNAVGTATRQGYKPAKYEVKADKKGVPVTKTVVLEPSKVENVIMGSVELPQGRSKENLFVEVKTEGKMVNGKYVSGNVEAYIKVKPDGTFKMYNLPNGEYTFTVVYGEIGLKSTLKSGRNNAMTMDTYAPFLSETVKVSGNLNKTIKVVDTGAKDIGYNNFFEKVDYSDPALAQVTPELEMSEEMKIAVDKSVNDKKDLTTLDEIGKFINSYFKDKPIPTDASLRDFSSVKQIEENGDGWLDDCGEYAMMYAAIARYKGIPTVFASALSGKGMESKNPNAICHVYLEVFVDGKWVLIDSTKMLIDTTYDKDDNTIYDTVGYYEGDYMYIHSKTVSPIGTLAVSNVNAFNANELSLVFDSSLLNTSTENKITR